jgi:nitroreductase
MPFPPADPPAGGAATPSRQRRPAGALPGPLRLLHALRPRWQQLKADMRWLAMSRLFVHDAVHALRHMSWRRPSSEFWRLSAELLFQYHKLEKGLCMPGERRFFGRDPIRATAALLERWRAAGLDREDPVYLGALEAVWAYARRVEQTPPPAEIRAAIERTVERALAGYRPRPGLATPRPVGVAGDGPTPDELDALFVARRSVRNFRGEPVPAALLEQAVAAAQLSPSACNRQPWRVHVYRDAEQIRRLLALQNGNTGFGHQLRTLLVITADSSGFFDATERHQSFVDAGLFAMSLILALQVRGVANCCLNWCVPPERDRQAHAAGDIPAAQRIVMYLAVGFADSEALVPRSPRRGLDTFIRNH